jgi:hypothetical protein
MTINKKTLRAGDQVWVTFVNVDAGGPHAWVYGGPVIAVSADGSFVYQRDGRQLETVRSYSVVTLHSTEAEAWEAAADRLSQIATSIDAKAAECRAHAHGEVTA